MSEPSDVGGVAGAELRQFIERIETLEAEKTEVAAQIKEVYSEAKGTGFDTGIIRKVISLRKKDRDKRMEEEELLELYKRAIGLD